MSLLKPGKFLKTEGKNQKGEESGYVYVAEVFQAQTNATFLVCPQVGLGLCSLTRWPNAVQEHHVAWPTPVKPAEHDCFSFPPSALHSPPAVPQISLFGLCNTNPVKTPFSGLRTHSLTMATDLSSEKNPHEQSSNDSLGPSRDVSDRTQNRP